MPTECQTGSCFRNKFLYVCEMEQDNAVCIQRKKNGNKKNGKGELAMAGNYSLSDF